MTSTLHLQPRSLCYRSTPRGTFNGQELSNQRRVTSIFVKDGGRWLTAGRQSTPVVTAKLPSDSL